MLEGSECRIARQRTFAVLTRRTGNADGVLVFRNERGGDVDQAEGSSNWAYFMGCCSEILNMEVGGEPWGVDRWRRGHRAVRPGQLPLQILGGEPKTEYK